MKRKRNLIIIGFIILGISSLLMWKWNTWFKNPTEERYTISCEPSRIMISLCGNDENSRLVSWCSDSSNIQPLVEYFKIDKKDTLSIQAKPISVKTQGGVTTSYHAKLTNLEPESTYKYRVCNKFKSDWFEFKTAKKDKKFSFVYMGDIQDRIGGKTGEVFSRINKFTQNTDFWLFGGDLLERPLNKYWDYWFECGKNIFNTKPMIACPGNHEYHKGLIKKIDKRWMSHFQFPKNGPENFKGRACYWNYKDAIFICLDTDGIQGIGSLLEQKNWIDNVLEKSNKKWKIVVMHHPIYSISNCTISPFLRTFIKPVLEKHKVDLVLQGHNHGYSRVCKKDNNEINTPVYVISTCSRKNYLINIDQNAERTGSNLKLFQVIDIDKSKLTYKSYESNGELYDRFEITKTESKTLVDNKIPSTPEKLEAPERYKKKKKTKLKAYYKEVEKRRAHNRIIKKLISEKK
ncbi:MAG: metallophosphoesterase family protein [Marinifilaceae bacterium]|jgi:hypothetical protein|nr:metallophosphoesterase family protein [Marinifilaceae bacterium]